MRLIRQIGLIRLIGIFLLLFSIGWNLWTYRLELTARLDPNDNTFQYALVDRTNHIWDYANKTCPPFFLSHVFCLTSLLADHWVPNWAQGYNLPYYYSHIPQITIVASYHFIRGPLALLQGAPLRNSVSLFQYYHLIIYLLLCLFPLSVFLALLITGLSPLSAGFGALIATHLSTDGLYGLDPPSFLWRGYGLSSQLFAMIWLPLAVAYLYKIFNSRGDVSIRSIVTALARKTAVKKRGSDFDDARTSTYRPQRDLILAILFLAATTAGHLGIGIMGFMSAAVFALSSSLFSLSNLSDLSHLSDLIFNSFKKLILLYGGVFLLLGYWILPILMHGNFHNNSVWDPIWKFDSYGYREILKNLLNGDLFDFGRWPILTTFVFIGFFVALKGAGRRSFSSPSERLGINTLASPEQSRRDGHAENDMPTSAPYFAFALLFLFWLLFYFGRTTWGGLIDLIPGMSDFHLSRFIVGVHIAGLFLIPIGFERMVTSLHRHLVTSFKHAHHFVTLLLCYFVVVVILVSFVFPQTTRYSTYNDFLIKRANTDFAKVSADTSSLLTKLLSLQASSPGRVYFGRGGNWGKDFKVAETEWYLYGSTYGIPAVLWLPETWSPNSDTEQYFSDDRLADYALYNVRYVATPIDLPKDQIRDFWKPLATGKTWRLYSVNVSPLSDVSDRSNLSSGYITTGLRPAIVSSSKENFINLVHLWIVSDFPKSGLYPELTFDKDYPKRTGLPNFRMVDEVTYKIPNGTLHNLFSEVPKYISPLSDLGTLSNLKIISQSQESDMVFRSTVEVPRGCTECLVILKQTFHPSWHATVDGKSVETMTVFPFYTAIKMDSPGLPAQAGKHEVVFSYRPSGIKIILLFISLLTLVGIIWLSVLKRKSLK